RRRGRTDEGARLRPTPSLRDELGPARSPRPDQFRIVCRRQCRVIPSARGIVAIPRPIRGSGGLPGLPRLPARNRHHLRRQRPLELHVDSEHGQSRTLFLRPLRPRILPRYLERESDGVARGMMRNAERGKRTGTVDAGPMHELDQLCINTIRTLALDAAAESNSARPRAEIVLAPVAYYLWQRVMRYDPI